MNFNEALETELKQIPEYDNQVYPLIAGQKTQAPFLVYKKANRKRRKTLNGTLNKIEGIYNLTILSKSYSQLEDLIDATSNRVLNFLGRKIGDETGPFIEDITIEELGDKYEGEPDFYRADMQITVKYQ